MKGLNGTTGFIPDWQVIVQGIAGRLGKQIAPKAFEVVNPYKINTAVLLREGAVPLVIWREKVTVVCDTPAVTYTEAGWRERGVYRLPGSDVLYLVDEDGAVEVDCHPTTFFRMMTAHGKYWQ